MGIQTSRTKTVFIDAARLGSAVPAFVRNHLTELAGGPGKPITQAVIDTGLSNLFATLGAVQSDPKKSKLVDNAIANTVQDYIRVTDDVDIYAHVSRTGSVLNLDLIR